VVILFEFLPRYEARENWSPWAIVRRCLRDPTFSLSVEHRLVTDRHRGRQTHDDGIYCAGMASRGKNCILWRKCKETNYYPGITAAVSLASGYTQKFASMLGEELVCSSGTVRHFYLNISSKGRKPLTCW